jgi:hypothetical protein
MEMEGARPQAGNISELDRVTSSKPKYLSGDGYETRCIVERYHGRLTCRFPSLRGSRLFVVFVCLEICKDPGDQRNAVFPCLPNSCMWCSVLPMNSSRTPPVTLDSVLFAFPRIKPV